MTVDCAILIICQNEQDNIYDCLKSVVGKFNEIYVCDGYSTDDTINIRREFDVQIVQNEFYHWAQQREYLLEWAKPESEFIFFLDADEIITEELYNEVRNFICNSNASAGSFAVKNIFMRRHLRFSYGHPRVIRLFRKKDYVGIASEGAREYFNNNGTVHEFRHPLHHEDKKGISNFINKQLKNAVLEAEFLTQQSQPVKKNIKEFIRAHIWIMIPLPLRPVMYFLYRYIAKLGFLDGVPGFVFCAVQCFLYQSLIVYHLHISQAREEED